MCSLRLTLCFSYQPVLLVPFIEECNLDPRSGAMCPYCSWGAPAFIGQTWEMYMFGLLVFPIQA